MNLLAQGWPTGAYAPPGPDTTAIAMWIIGIVVACLLIRFAASGGTMKRITPEQLEAVRARGAAREAHRDAVRLLRELDLGSKER